MIWEYAFISGNEQPEDRYNADLRLLHNIPKTDLVLKWKKRLLSNLKQTGSL